MTRLLRRLHQWLRRSQHEADLIAELEAHRQMAQDRLEGQGLARDEAAAATRRALGNITLAREDARRVWIWPWVESVGQDVRYAIRSLRRQPGLTITALLTFGLGIGLNTSVATMFQTMLWQPWGVTDPASVVLITKAHVEGGGSSEFGFHEYRDLAANARGVAIVATNCGASPRTEDCFVKLDDKKAMALFVSANYFDVLGVTMARGRPFSEVDDLPTIEPTLAVISDEYWQTRLAADPGIIGRQIRMDAVPFTVVGVLPSSFAGASLLRRDVFVPLAARQILRPASRTRGSSSPDAWAPA